MGQPKAKEANRLQITFRYHRMPVSLDIQSVSLTCRFYLELNVYEKTYYIKYDLFYEICLITGEECGRNGLIVVLQMNTVMCFTHLSNGKLIMLKQFDMAICDLPCII